MSSVYSPVCTREVFRTTDHILFFDAPYFYEFPDAVRFIIQISLSRKFNYFAEIGRNMKLFGNDKVKLLIVILLISLAIFAVSIILDLNILIIIAVGVVMFFVILLIALYGYENEE
jgi:hypothetical protein